MNFKTLAILTLIFTGIAFSSCERSDDAGSKAPRLKILLTDAPFPADLVAEANVVINKVEIRNQNYETDAYPFITLSEEEMHFNLLDLTNGVTAPLVDMEVEPGNYDLVRLYVSDASIVLKDSTVYDMKVPSGAQTGIKVYIDPAVQVAEGLTAELILDFNVSKSFVALGNPNAAVGIKGFIFKPVVKATNNTVAGRLMGVVTDTSGVAIEGAEVSLLAADTVYTSSLTDTTGAYSVIGVDAGMYDVAFAKDGFQNDTIPGVEIILGNITTQDAILVPDEVVEEGEGEGGGE